MGKRSTLPRIAFFSIILAGFILIQYSWIKSLQNDKLQKFRSRIISAIANEKLPRYKTLHELNATIIANVLSQSFSAAGLGNVQLEFSIDPGDNHLTSHGFIKTIDDPGSLILYYEFPDAPTRLTMIIPGWEKYVLNDMVWIFAASWFLTIMITAIFCYATFLNGRRRQLFYDNKTDLIRNLIQQLETPLSTISVAVEALRNRKVMHNSEKRNYYQQIISEESKRINEKVKIILEDQKITKIP